MSRRHNRAVMLVIEGGTSEINQPNVGGLDATHLSVLDDEKSIINIFKYTRINEAISLNTHLLVIVRRRVLRIDEQNILRLQVGVRQSVLVQEFHREAHLVGHVSHVVQRVRLVIVFALHTRDWKTIIFHSKVNAG